MKQGATESDVMAALAKKYCAPAWAFLPQVPDGTGSHKTRTADAMAMSLYPSRGLHIHGFEIKTWRGDWIRELRDPKKADGFCARCDFWWIATLPDIVREGELPPTWGLMVMDARGMVVKQPAPPLSPVVLDRTFLAAILRRASEDVTPKSTIGAQLSAEYDKGFKAGQAKMDQGQAERKLTELQNNVQVFQEASGVKLSGWDNGDIGKAVDAVLHLQRAGINIADWLDGNVASLERLCGSIQRDAKQLRDCLKVPEPSG